MWPRQIRRYRAMRTRTLRALLTRPIALMRPYPATSSTAAQTASLLPLPRLHNSLNLHLILLYVLQIWPLPPRRFPDKEPLMREPFSHIPILIGLEYPISRGNLRSEAIGAKDSLSSSKKQNLAKSLINCFGMYCLCRIYLERTCYCSYSSSFPTKRVADSATSRFNVSKRISSMLRLHMAKSSSVRPISQQKTRLSSHFPAEESQEARNTLCVVDFSALSPS